MAGKVVVDSDDRQMTGFDSIIIEQMNADVGQRGTKRLCVAPMVVIAEHRKSTEGRYQAP